MTIKEFRSKIKTKDVEGNRTYLYVVINGKRYGQSYQNTVNTIEGMKDNFCITYFDMAINEPAYFTCDNKRCGKLVTKTYRTYWLKNNKDICEVCYQKQKPTYPLI